MGNNCNANSNTSDQMLILTWILVALTNFTKNEQFS